MIKKVYFLLLLLFFACKTTDQQEKENYYKLNDLKEVTKLDLGLNDAIKIGDFSKVKELINNGADVNAKFEQMLSPLHQAAESSQLEIAKFLISKNANVNMELYNSGLTPLYFTAQSGSLEMVKLLVVNGANVNQNDAKYTIIGEAAEVGSLAVVKYLLDNGADLNVLSHYSTSLLHSAVLGGNIELVKFLINDKKMDINFQNDNQMGIFEFAAESGSLDMVKYVLEEVLKTIPVNNDKDRLEKGFMTVLDMAKTKGNNELIKYLQSKGFTLTTDNN